MSVKRPRVRYLREVWMKVKDPDGLIRARKRAGFTQRNLAALSDCTQATISALETGAMRGCSQDLAFALAKWLDRDVEDLFEAHAGTRMHRVTNAAGSTRHPTSPTPTPRRPRPRRTAAA